MTPKQERFVAEYLVDLNATQAAIRAGYSRKNADQIGSQLLGKTKVAAAIAEGREKLNQQSIVSRERVLQELVAIGMSDIRKLYDDKGNLRNIHELDDATAASIAGIESMEEYQGHGQEREAIGMVRKVKRFDKTKALEMLGRHLGLWKDPEKPPTEGPGLTVIVEQRIVAAGPAALGQQVVVQLAAPERA